METRIPSSMFLVWSRGWSLNGSQGGTNSQRAVDRQGERGMEADKTGDSRLRLIKKMAKPRGRGSKANPAPTPPLLPILGRWPRADAAAEKDICPHGNSRRGGGEPGSAGVTSR